MKLPLDFPRSDQPSPIPPLSQSRYGDMACEALYVRKHVERARLGESEPAARGTEIHQILATYINHLVRTKLPTDLEVFDSLAKYARAEAREVLEKFRDNHSFDPEKVLATELHIALNENFLPIQHPGGISQTAEYEGTLDLVQLHSVTEAEVGDWKSYYQDRRRGHISIEVISILVNVPQSISGEGEIRTRVRPLRSFAMC